MAAKILHSAKGHTVKAVKVEAVSNGELVVCLCCCDNPTTEHRHTMGNLHLFSPAEVEAKLSEVAKFVAAQHESMDAAIAHIKILVDAAAPPAVSKPTLTKLD